jgi:SAM-dependent methyltransferase
MKQEKDANSQVEPPPSLVLKIQRSIRRRGLKGTIRLAALKGFDRLQGAIFDRRFGVETSGNVELQDLEIGSPDVVHGIRYQPTPARAFEEVVAALDINVGDFVLVDFGCGKGRTLLLAAKMGFKKAIGVEFSRDLASIAVANAKRMGVEDKVEVVHQDASLFVPPVEKCVFYFFLPFLDPVMSVVLENIKRSIDAHPREFRIALYDPPRRENLEGDSAFKRVAQASSYVIYGPGGHKPQPAASLQTNA